jgi:SulP family sulfate permease
VVLLMVVFLSDCCQIPMAALVAVMIMVSIGTFSWDSMVTSVGNSRSPPKVVMLCHRRSVTVYTHNLAYGGLSVLLAALLFRQQNRSFSISIQTPI